MGSVTYYVAMGFERSEEGDLVAMDPMESQSSSQAISRARALASTKAGAVAFSRTVAAIRTAFAERRTVALLHAKATADEQARQRALIDAAHFAPDDAVVLFTAGEVPDELPTG